MSAIEKGQRWLSLRGGPAVVEVIGCHRDFSDRWDVRYPDGYIGVLDEVGGELPGFTLVDPDAPALPALTPQEHAESIVREWCAASRAGPITVEDRRPLVDAIAAGLRGCQRPAMSRPCDCAECVAKTSDETMPFGRRDRIATAVLAGLVSRTIGMEMLEVAADSAVRFADALVKSLDGNRCPVCCWLMELCRCDQAGGVAE